MEKAIFAAGCFWGIEDAFRKMPGVENTRVGYTGGNKPNPTYKEVCSGNTGHAEAVEIEYDPEQIRYEDLLNLFWHIHDPTQVNRQGPDIGSQYRSAIFYTNEAQKEKAEHSKQLLEQNGQFNDPIATEIIQADTFYPAEEYHQKYFLKNGISS